MVEKRRHRSDRYRLIPVSAVYTRGERLHKIRDRPAGYGSKALLSGAGDLPRPRRPVGGGPDGLGTIRKAEARASAF